MTRSKRLTIYTALNSKALRIIDDWSKTDKVTLMGRLMIYEALTHWLWMVFVIFKMTSFDLFVDPYYLVVLLIGCTIFIFAIWVLNDQIPKIKPYKNRFIHHQMTMLVAYITYISGFILLIGQDSFVSGICILSVVVGLLLVDRQIIWRLFLVQCVITIALTLLPYWIGEFPSLRQTTFANNDVLEESRFFWRLSYLYLGLPKAMAIVFTVRKLLDGIQYRKQLIRYKAEYDELTKIRNRRGLFEITRRSLCLEVNRYDCSFILIDLDHFKQVNDVYGHLAGDKMLYQVAQLFKNILPDSAKIGRYGGEEFLAVLPNTSSEAALKIAHHLRTELACKPIDVDENNAIAMTSSFGVASLHIDCIDFIYKVHQRVLSQHQLQQQFNLEFIEMLKVVVDQADQALYDAKYQGRNRVMVSPVVYFDKLQHLGSFGSGVLIEPLDQEDAGLNVP